jgi:hypothetical protein
MRFATEITLTGPLRRPAQMLADQQYEGHASIHDDATAASLGLAGAPIEGPTHFSQFDPLAFTLWGPAWFERGCLSSHFQTMVVEGEQVQAVAVSGAGGAVRIDARKATGETVLSGTMSLGPQHGETELAARLARTADPGPLVILDRLAVGMREEGDIASVTFEEPNGEHYPFSLVDKLRHITEPHPWYTPEGGAASPWGRPVLPMEMMAVLAHKAGATWPVRTPSIGLFLDLEIRLLDGPVFVGQRYELQREIVGLGQSRKTESYWTRTTLVDADTGKATAEVLLHQGRFKASYPAYPAELLAP